MKMKSLLITLVTWCFACWAEAAVTTPQTGAYRLTSGRSSSKIMAVNSSGELIVSARKANDFNQLWLVEKKGTTYLLRNIGNGRYVQPQTKLSTKYATDNAKATFYIRKNLEKSGDTYYNISSKSDFSGTSCLHEDASARVVPWSAGDGSAVTGSEWKFEAADDITKDQIKERFDRLTGSTLVEEGKYYRIMSPEYNRALIETVTSRGVTTDETADDLTQYWTLEKQGTGYYIKNAYTGRYLLKQGGVVSTQYRTNTKPNGAFTLSVNNNFPYELRYNIVDNKTIVLHTAATQNYNAVGWYISNGTDNLASVWYFQEVNPSEADIEAAQKEFQALQDAQTNERKYRQMMATFFDDDACTILKSEYRSMDDAALRQAMSELPSTIQEAAVKIKNNSWSKWEKEFRVASYGIYSDPSYWAKQLKMSAYGRQNNPTGIVADKNQVLYVFVGSNVPTGATLKIETSSTTSVFGDYSKTPTKGLNVVVAPADNSHLFVMYTSKNGTDISRYANLDIHIEGGRVNGFFDCTKYNNKDWAQMKADGLFKAPVIDVMGEYIHWHMSTSYVKNNVRDKITEVMAVWDSTAYWELDLMGLLKSDKYPDIYEDIYPRKFNNKMECTTVTSEGSYMYSTSYYTGYNEYSTGNILQYDNVIKGDGTLWGPAHEIGHSNQGAIRIVGTTEVSNNLFSNMVMYRTGKYTTRYWNIQEMQQWMPQKLSWLELYGKNSERETIGLMNRMFFQLYLYYHALGNHPTFYQEVFKALRKSPLVQPTSPAITYAKDDYLKFARVCSQVAGEDLSEYFEYWGFFRPIEKYQVGDYATWLVTATQKDIDDTKAAIKACGKPNGNIIFVEDRVTEEMGRDGKPKRTLESYSVANCRNDMGQYTDFPKHLEASGYIYVVDARGYVTVTSLAKNAVGIKVYDKDGNLAYVSASRKFMLPSYLVSEGGYTLVAAQSDGTDVKMFNKKTDTYYTMNVYRGTNSPVVRYTDGKAESATIPVLKDNDIAVLAEDNAPEQLTTMQNVIAAGNVVHNMVLDNTHPFYAPQDFTAKKLTFNLSYKAGNNAMTLPFAIKQSDLAGDTQIKAFKATEEKDGVNYIVFDDKTDEIGAGVPFLFCNNSKEEGIRSITATDVAMAGKAASIKGEEITLYGSFMPVTLTSGKYLLNGAGTSFDLTADKTDSNAFSIWMEKTTAGRPSAYVIAGSDPTSVKNIATDLQTGKEIYDLQGRKAGNTPGKGIYIVNKKKVVLK